MMSSAVKSKSKFKRCKPLLGTFVEITLVKSGRHHQDSLKAHPAPSKVLERAFKKAFAAIEEVSNVMSFHDVNSDLSKLNRAKLGAWITVDPKLIKVLTLALELQEKSGGIFNVAIGKPLVNLKILPGKKSLSAFRHLSEKSFEIRGGSEVRRLFPVKLDLGGIAKGFAVDQAVGVLKRFSSLSGCVNAGGDLRVFGRESQTVCVIIKRHRNRNGLLTSLCDRSLASSEIIPVKKISPYVDTRNKKVVSTNYAAVVSAPSCMVADALTKVALLGPLRIAEKLASFYRADLRVFR